MLTRIQKIMDEKQLSVSAFADEIGVKRPTMTHVMTGRNNPSLDIISKILERFTDLNSDWLLFGKGSMYRSSQVVQPSLFGEADQELIRNNSQAELNTPIEAISKISTIFSGEDKYYKRTTEEEKKIAKILIFFSDNTFETFLPEDSSKK